MEVLGVKMRRLMLVVSGLDHTEVVLGWDTIKKEGMIVNRATGGWRSRREKLTRSGQ
jgi:hypothetical protein